MPYCAVSSTLSPCAFLFLAAECIASLSTRMASLSWRWRSRASGSVFDYLKHHDDGDEFGLGDTEPDGDDEPSTGRSPPGPFVFVFFGSLQRLRLLIMYSWILPGLIKACLVLITFSIRCVGCCDVCSVVDERTCCLGYRRLSL